MAFDAELATKPTLNFKAFLEAFLEVDPGYSPNSPIYPYPRPTQPHDPDPSTKPLPNDLSMLKFARERIKMGWTKKEMYNPHNNGVCAVGALFCAVQGSQVPNNIRTASDEYQVERLGSLVAYSASALMSINDAYETTKEQVIALFTAAIERLEKRLLERGGWVSREEARYSPYRRYVNGSSISYHSLVD